MPRRGIRPAERGDPLTASGDGLAYVYRISKYDPADRDESGHYVGTEETTGDHGPVEEAHLRAVAAFAEEAGVDRLAVREPHLSGAAPFGGESAALAGVFPPDFTAFHDGAEVPIAVGLELVRVMLRESGAWCRLEAGSAFAVHVGWDQYVYVGTDRPGDRASAQARALGLFPERVDASPYAYDADVPDGARDVEQRPADDVFWARVRWLVAVDRAAILEERFAGGDAARRHRLSADTLEEVRARLTPRSQLVVWSGQRRPLCTAVLPDGDGVLRARWRTEPTQSDRHWAVLKHLRKGQVCTGTVTEIASFHVTFVDIGGFTAMINIPELSWRRFEHPSEIVSVGQEITAEILEVDMVRERVPLSLKALHDNPMEALAQRVGEVVTGRVTKVIPIGVFVRIEDRPDGYEGLVPHGADGGQGLDVQVGDTLRVTIVDVEPGRRRIELALEDGSGGTGPR